VFLLQEPQIATYILASQITLRFI